MSASRFIHFQSRWLEICLNHNFVEKYTNFSMAYYNANSKQPKTFMKWSISFDLMRLTMSALQGQHSRIQVLCSVQYNFYFHYFNKNRCAIRVKPLNFEWSSEQAPGVTILWPVSGWTSRVRAPLCTSTHIQWVSPRHYSVWDAVLF